MVEEDYLKSIIANLLDNVEAKDITLTVKINWEPEEDDQNDYPEIMTIPGEQIDDIDGYIIDSWGCSDYSDYEVIGIKIGETNDDE